MIKSHAPTGKQRKHLTACARLARRLSRIDAAQHVYRRPNTTACDCVVAQRRLAIKEFTNADDV